MDPDRHLPHPARNPARNQPQLMSSPDPQPRPPPPTTSPYQQPSLPSIRQLHPYLPPSGMPQPHLPAQATSTYTYPLHAPYAGPSSTDPHISPPASSHTATYPRSELLESEAEGEAEPQGPAKKKRRRQALSCNECKRRKIKCDRAQPCGPCTRRGEQSKCQWRTLEPVDKYVTRQEYEALKEQSRVEHDQLKRRVDHLESMVSRIFSAPSGGAVGLPIYSMPLDISGPSTENISSYRGGSSSHATYTPSVPPSIAYHTEITPKHHYYPTASSPMIPEGAPQVSPSAAQTAPGSGGLGHIRRPSDSKSPTQPRQVKKLGRADAQAAGRASAPGTRRLERPSGTSLRYPSTMEPHPTPSSTSDVTMGGSQALPTAHHIPSSSRGRPADSPGSHSGVTSGREVEGRPPTDR